MVWFFRQFIISYIEMMFPSCDQPGVSRVYVARPLLRSSAGDLCTLAPRPSPAESHQVYRPAAKLEVVSYLNRTRQGLDRSPTINLRAMSTTRQSKLSSRVRRPLPLIGRMLSSRRFLEYVGGRRALAVRARSKSKRSPSYMCSGVPHQLVTLRERESIN
jgi:hypothetical protein